MAARDWAAATKALQQLAKLAPAVPEVHANLGLAYYSQNLIAEAAAEFDADVLIIGRTSDGESAGRLRDLTYAVVRDAPFPVLSV